MTQATNLRYLSMAPNVGGYRARVNGASLPSDQCVRDSW